MSYGDYRDYNKELGNDRACSAADRRRENPPDDEEEDLDFDDCIDYEADLDYD